MYRLCICTYVVQGIDMRVALLLSKRARRETWVLGKPRDTVSLIERDRYHDFVGCLCIPWRTTFRSFRGSTFHTLFRPRVPFLRLNACCARTRYLSSESIRRWSFHGSVTQITSAFDFVQKWSMLLDRNRVSLSVDTSSKYIFYQPIEKLCKFVQI